MCLLPELPGQEDKEDDEAEEGWASSADGDSDARLADNSAQTAKPLTTSPPPSAGEQTNLWRIPNKLTLKKCPLICCTQAHAADLFAEHVKGCKQLLLPRRFYISKSVKGVEGTITLHPLPETPNCFQREEKTAGSGRDFGGATCEMRGDEKQWLINNAPPAPFIVIRGID